jgi:tetratricopeptide (TPR) repeat protein
MQNIVMSRLIKILSTNVFLICAVFLTLAIAQQTGHTLRGKVYLPGNNTNASKSVRVQLLSKGTLIAQTVTDASGSYIFSPVVNGNYQILIESDGTTFSTTIVDVQIFFMSGNRLPQIVTQDISLTSKDNTQNSSQAALSDLKLDASIPKDAKKAYEKGSKSAKKGNTREALEYLNNAIQIYPKYYDAHMALGELYAKNQDFLSAEVAFNQAIELKPKAAEAYFHLGVVLVKDQKAAEATEKLRQAMQLGDKSANTYMFLGLALMNMAEYQESEKMLIKALDIAGNVQPGIRIYLADCYERWGKKIECIEQLEAYVRAVPTAPNTPNIEKLIKQLKEQK